MVIDYTFLVIMLGAVLFGIVAGIIGVFVLLRQQALLSDALSHAALPGIVGVFLITGCTDMYLLLTGGACASGLGLAVIRFVLSTTKLKKDTVFGIVLSVFFGLGLVFMTLAQKGAHSGQLVVKSFLFGNVSTLLPSDLYMLIFLVMTVIVCLSVLWKEWNIYLFDELYGAQLGFSASKLTFLCDALLLVSLVIGLQSMGVILMNSLIVSSAVAARQWTERLSSMIIVSGFLGGVSALLGVCVSSFFMHMPTGPVIVVIACMIVFMSCLFCSAKRKVIVCCSYR